MSPLVLEDDVAAVAEQMRSFWIGRGARVEELERTMAGWVGARHALALGSGTAALVVALKALPGSTVSYTNGCDALDVAAQAAGKVRGDGGASIAIYPQRGADVEDFARHLPARGEARLEGRFGVFSFGALKDVSGGIGGCIVSNEPISGEYYRRISPLSDINAAMILSQLWRYQGKVRERLVAGGKTWCG